MNHNKDSNVEQLPFFPHYTYMVAARDIKEGEEIFIDYCGAEKDEGER